MRQVEIENGNFPPKSIEQVVTATPCIALKGIKSVESARDSVKVTIRERSPLHNFPPKRKLARQLVFTEFGLSPISISSPSLVNSSSEQHLSPQSPLSYKSESPLPLHSTNMKANNGTPKYPKQCGCKQSKCLKLYCECFASGEYCNGCNCTECCNNVENEDLRKAVAEIILERNPHAFKPKIASTPCSPQNGDEATDAAPVGRNERGCHCKRSQCIKRYCECFQANVLCSTNCKCMDCKNFEACKDTMAAFGKNDSESEICKKSEGCEGIIATSPRDNGIRKLFKSLKVSEGLNAVNHENSIDTKIHIQRNTAATSNATGSLGQCLSQESRKRKHLELNLDEKDSLIESFYGFQKVNNLKNRCHSATISIEPTCHNINSAMMGSLRNPYRLMAADVYHLQDTSDINSGLAVLAEAAALAQSAKLFTDKVDKADMKNEVERSYKNTLGDKENNCQWGPVHVQRNVSDDLNVGFGANYGQEGRTLPPGTFNICNEKHEQFIKPASPNQILNCNINSVYAEQEKCVLTTFLDFLQKLVAFTNIKDDASSYYGDKPVLIS
ncbi:hypothetical protein CCACVL1_28091 [Corchorus capsularis]|uniref:CRC domain-containing protein n=1 Tax=Corchorus capsularis TaxID=210143 RepID=A0A1R3G7R6_COCAP|nr:hypothetical protein CCACVL1_28091 [Corchorus capsularis]